MRFCVVVGGNQLMNEAHFEKYIHLMSLGIFYVTLKDNRSSNYNYSNLIDRKMVNKSPRTMLSRYNDPISISTTCKCVRYYRLNHLSFLKHEVEIVYMSICRTESLKL